VNAGNGFRPGTLPEASAGRFACHDVCNVISGLDTTLADEAMADPRTILFCNDGSNVTRKALFKETAYCQAVWITILEVCPKTLPGFFASGMPQLCDLAPVSKTMRSSLQRAIRALMSPHPRRNGKKIFSLKCSNALHSRARKPPPGE
jgi:hypothetical protein